MDLDKRIEEIERRIAELARAVERLAAGKAPEALLPHDSEEDRRAAPPKLRPVLQTRVRDGVDRVLGGEAGDTLETRIGGIWLSRIAVVLLMTAAALGARLTLYSEVLEPIHKIGIFYGMAAFAVAYGLAGWRSTSFFPQTILGAGLAGIYFTTYGAFFIDGMRVLTDERLALAALLTCLALLVGVSHLRRSETVAGIAFFLVYYTVVASCMGGRTAEHIQYALLTCAVVALVTLVFHALHRWLLFTWAALVATYGTYLYFFLREPAGLGMTGREYFWLSNAFLSLCYVLFCLAYLIDARKTGEYRRNVAPMAGVNSFIYVILSWSAVRQHYPAEEWMFRMGFAGYLLLMAILLEVTGPRRNYLFQIFIAKTVIMFTLALQAYLSTEILIVAMAIECLALSFSYKRSGIVVFKALGLLLLFITFFGGLAYVRTRSGILIGPYAVPANWFCCAGSAIVFTIVAWFYEHFVADLKPEDRVVGGQRFLADTLLDVHSGTMALLHAAAAALLLLTLTILDRGNDPRLPFLLAGEAVAMVAAGFLLRTAQVEVGGVLLLVAAHLCYHVFLAMGTPGFEQQPHYLVYTVLLALFTYVGAHLWERYLQRIQGGRPWEHHAVAAVPYLAATYMLTTLLGRQLSGLPAPLAQNTLGVALLLAGVLTGYTGVKASGLLALGIGGANVCYGLQATPNPFTSQPHFLAYFGPVLLTYALAERLFALFQQREKAPSPGTDFVRSVLVGVAGVLGLIGVSLYAPAEQITFYWLGLAVLAVVFGGVFRESRYRWAAMLLFAATIGRAFAHDLRQLSPMLQFLSFAALSVPLLVVSWAYSRYRQKALRHAQATPEEDVSAHG